MNNALVLTLGVFTLALSWSPAAAAQPAVTPWGTPAPTEPPPPPAPKAAPEAAPAAPSAWAAPAAAPPVVTPAAGSAVPALADPGDAHVTAGVVVRVSDRDAASAVVIAAAKERGGWFSALSPEQVQLKVPRGAAREIVALAGTLGEVADQSFGRTDLTPQLGDVRGRLESRRKVLDRYLEVLRTASPGAVVSVEREVTRLVAEIEQLEGQLKVLEHRAAYADVTVSFRFRERRAPTNDGSSSFAWINTLNAADVFADFRSGERARRSASAPVAPDGFAPYRWPWRFQAASPDGVLYRVRSERHKPKADLGFWREAVRERMVAAGYKLLSDTEITSADGAPGVRLTLGAANGADDLTYVLAFFVDGGRVVIAEAAGDAEEVAPRMQAIEAAMSGIDL